MNKCTMIMRNTFVLIAFALAGLSTHKLLGKTEAKATGPTKQFTKNLRRDRYLLLDSRIVEKTENARLTLGKVQKHESNPLFGEDKPWEKRFDNLYPSVIHI